MDVSIIIVNYNTKVLTANCIESIFSHTQNIEIEVILVDNNSTDGSVDFFRSDKRVILVENTTNMGFGRANVEGLKVATGMYVLFLNSDTLLGNNAIKHFFDKMEASDKHIGCLGTLLKDKDGKIIHSYGKFPTIRYTICFSTFVGGILRRLGVKSSDKDNPQWRKGDFFKVDYITGADLFVRRYIIDKLGSFDPHFFMYYEETDMQKRYSENGVLSYIYTCPEIFHLEGVSSKRKEHFKRKALSVISSFIYHKKHNSTLNYYAFRIIFAMLELSRIFQPVDTLKGKLSYIKLVFNFKEPKI